MLIWKPLLQILYSVIVNKLPLQDAHLLNPGVPQLHLSLVFQHQMDLVCVAASVELKEGREPPRRAFSNKIYWRNSRGSNRCTCTKKHHDGVCSQYRLQIEWFTKHCVYTKNQYFVPQ